MSGAGTHRLSDVPRGWKRTMDKLPTSDEPTSSKHARRSVSYCDSYVQEHHDKWHTGAAAEPFRPEHARPHQPYLPNDRGWASQHSPKVDCSSSLQAAVNPRGQRKRSRSSTDYVNPAEVKRRREAPPPFERQRAEGEHYDQQQHGLGRGVARMKANRRGGKVPLYGSPRQGSAREFVWQVAELRSIVASPTPQAVLRQVLAEQVRFRDLLQSTRDCYDAQRITLTVDILKKVAILYNSSSVSFHLKTEAGDVLENLLSFSEEECSPFWCGLAVLIRKAPYFSFRELHTSTISVLNGIHTLMETLLEKRYFRDNAVPILPVDDLCGALSQLASQESSYRELKEKSERLLALRDTAREETRARVHHGEQILVVATNTASILPTPDELSHRFISTEVQSNIVEGAYASTEDYLRFHCRLLREDFVHPLRCALNKLEGGEECLGVKLYHDVHVVGFDITREGLVHKVSFKLPHGCKPRWEHNKQLLYGALLCLSIDHFSTVRFATVAERNPKELHNGIATIKFIEESHAQEIHPQDKFEMIQSPAYFESYAPVLTHLQTLAADSTDLPFAKYIVECHPHVSPPTYLTERGGYNNLKGVLCNCQSGDECVHGYSTAQILDDSFWTEAKEKCKVLDESQVEALQASLTKELAIIQGPPGTGKTYVGVKLVKALLKNRSIFRDTPIMVMCYTNHALDQFLIEVLKLKGSEGLPENLAIRRLGGRTKSEIIDRLNVRNYLTWPRRRGGKLYSHKIASTIRCEILALESLCLHSSPEPLYDQLYCSYLHPDRIRLCPEFEPLQKYIPHNYSFHDDLKAVFKWLGIRFIERDREEEAEHIFCDPRAEEDDRRIHMLDIEFFSGSEVKVYTSTEDLRRFVHDLQQVDPELVTSQYLSHGYRCKLFKYCLKKLLQRLKKEQQAILAKKTTHDQTYISVMADALGKADIIGLTTTGASKYNNIISKVRSKIVIVEEAAEVLEAHVIAALSRHTQHLVLIGDHKQLRPKTTDHTLATNFKLNVSLFERLINNNFECITLTQQHRMRPEISSLIHPHIYPVLIDHESVLAYDHIRGMQFDLFFLDHRWNESPDEDLRSPHNDMEADFVAHLCHYLLQQRYEPSQITVLTPYTGQVVCLKKHFRSPEIHASGVRITPIDHFQGEESDIIILSLVRSYNIGFLREENRICVAMSRAKKGFYCIGNLTFLSSKAKLWKTIISSVKDKNLLGPALSLQCQCHETVTTVSSPHDFHLIPDGGCREECKYRLSCGHICPRMCHPDDPDHKAPCEKPCVRMCPAHLHHCKDLCGKPCPECTENVEKTLSRCGHSQLVPCHKNPEFVKCQQPCPKKLACGHLCKRKCGEACTKECRELKKQVWPCGHEAQAECFLTPLEYMKHRRCRVRCDADPKQAELACGHLCKGTCGRCYQGRIHIPCKEKCTRILFCGHQCKSSNCSQDCPPCSEKCINACSHAPCGRRCKDPCIPCAEPCEWKCPHFTCNNPCGELCNRPRCNEPCLKKQRCGHPCMGLCGEPCPPVCRQCCPDAEGLQLFLGHEDEPDARFIQLIDCGHTFEVRDLDKYMDMDEGEHTAVQWKRCPRCKEFIRQSLRYGNVLKQIQKDMNQIKLRKFVSLPRRQRVTLLAETVQLCREYGREIDLKEERLHDASDKALQGKHAVLLALSVAKATLGQIKNLNDNIWFENKRMSASIKSTSLRELEEHVLLLQFHTEELHQFLTSFTCKQLVHLPQQVYNDIHAERRRLSLLGKVYQLRCDVIRCSLPVPLSTEEEAEINDQVKRFSPPHGRPEKMTDEEEYLKRVNKIKEISNRHPQLNPITPEERLMVVQAVGGRAGSWFKCPNGHYYHIGECGGAMEEGRCIECRAPVGGRNHRLREDNTHASEMDGSQYAAWSEQANLRNYDLRGIQ